MKISISITICENSKCTDSKIWDSRANNVRMVTSLQPGISNFAIYTFRIFRRQYRIRNLHQILPQKPPKLHRKSLIFVKFWLVEIAHFWKKIVFRFIDSRVLLAEASAKEGLDDDPLEDEVLRQEQLDVLAQLGRY